MSFLLTDIPRILPEILLLVLALLILGSDVFERWADGEQVVLERHRASASLAALGLGMIFAITLLQSGYLYTVPDTADSNYFTNLLRNLQAGIPRGSNVPLPVMDMFATDHLTIIGRLLFTGAAFLVVLLTYDHPPLRNPGEFYSLLVLSTLGMCLMAGATELIMLFLAIELTSIPLYILAGYFRNDRQSVEAGMKYFLYGAFSSAILLYGMSLVYGYAASTAGSADLTALSTSVITSFDSLRELFAQAGEPAPILLMGMLFMIAGIGYKIAIVPFHGWSPDVYQGAPTTMTAFISTASKAAGFFLLLRVLDTVFPNVVGNPIPVFDEFGGWTGMLALLAALTLIIANLAALPQTNAKRLLAYSGIAHAGFLLMGVIAQAAPFNTDRLNGVVALLYYLVVYALMNIGAFGVIAIVAQDTGSDEITALNGLAQRNLGLAALFTVFIFALAGIPPLAGFFAKFYIMLAVWQANAIWLVVIALISTIPALYYYLRLLRAVFIVPPDNSTPMPTPRWMMASLVVSAVLILVLGLFPAPLLDVLEQVQVVVIAGR